MSHKLDISKFDCEYAEYLYGFYCTTHSQDPMAIGSRYPESYGPNRPCTAEENTGVWLFYDDHGYASDAANTRMIVPYQLLFTLEGIPFDIENTMQLAHIANGMNVLAAIDIWEKK